jgi:hypothetical protein
VPSGIRTVIFGGEAVPDQIEAIALDTQRVVHRDRRGLAWRADRLVVADLRDELRRLAGRQVRRGELVELHAERRRADRSVLCEPAQAGRVGDHAVAEAGPFVHDEVVLIAEQPTDRDEYQSRE